MMDSEEATEQSVIDPFSEMNRYDRHEDWPSSEVYEPPRRTLSNYWAKFHAARDCGARNVEFVENATHRPLSERYEYKLRCWECGHTVPEDEILFVGGDWYSEHGWLEYGNPLDDLFIPPERVLELGPDPDRDELVHALNLSRIEREASVFGLSFGNERYRECDDCGQETFLLFDQTCRMCYEGEWTERMQEIVDTTGTSILVRNNSFAHRLESEVDPFSIKGRAFTNKILWRRHSEENVPRMVEVVQCLKDDAGGHWEYVLADLTHTNEWRYHEDDLQACFYDTGLYSESAKPIMDEDIREAYQHVCEHSFHDVHDAETGEVTGQQCFHCRKLIRGGPS